jgi:hypothetical protein
MLSLVALTFLFLGLGIVLIIAIVLLIVRALRSRAVTLQSRQALIGQQQVIREETVKRVVIVKVRCSYCASQFDETLDKCPYCGAQH